MLFEMLAGRLPFIASTAGDLIAMHITRDPPELGHCAPNVSERMAALVARMLGKLPHERPTMTAVEEELTQIERQVLDGKAISTRDRRRRGQLWRLGGVGAAILGGAVGLWQVAWLRPQRELPPAAKPGPGVAALPMVAVTPPGESPASVVWAVSTVPTGARVVRAADQVVLGTTPWRERAPKSDGSVEVSIELGGFVPQRLVLSRAQDTLRELTLTAIAPTVTPDARPGSEPPRGRHIIGERPRDRVKPPAPAGPSTGSAASPAVATPSGEPAASPTAAVATSPPSPSAALPTAPSALPSAAPPTSASPAVKPKPEQPRDDDIEVPALH